MKIPLAILLAVALVGCAPLPQTEIQVVSARGVPLAGFPLRVEFSSGLSGYAQSNSTIGTLANRSELQNIRTDEKGKAVVQYIFSEKQPSTFRRLFPGAKWVPHQWIKITPMQDLPKGSSITTGIPNP